jgi:peptidoglycan/xylan/chitin deacetylase (PgdA/CDA1 family)
MSLLVVVMGTTSSQQISTAQNSSIDKGQNAEKVVILTFDDGWKSQYQNAKPILDKYGYKGTFFIVCNYVGKDDTRMNWEDVTSLIREGHDIQAHTMNHKNLSKLSAYDLDYELAESKQCLGSHGVNSTIMATPLNEGWDNSTVIQNIAKYYELARNGNSPLMFLHCDMWSISQIDCRTFFDNGSLTFANRYSIRAWSHNFYDNRYPQNETRIFDEFVKVVNRQQEFNNSTKGIMAVPIIIYHNIDNTKSAYATTTNLFQREMKYLYDNGFRVLTMSNLKFNNDGKYLYIN